MLRLRRTDHDLRIEMTPMMDVVFLLLTFFIYAMVLMIPPVLLPAQMQQFASGQPAKPAPAATLSIDPAGQLRLNDEEITLADVVSRLQEIKSANPETVIYIAADQRGQSDRLPLFLELYDRLAFAGLDIKLVGKPVQDEPQRHKDAARN